MSGNAKEAEVHVETRTFWETSNEADHKFIIALAMIIAYAVMLAIPVITRDTEMFKLIATAMSGAVGTIVGYYFGTRREGTSVGEET